MGSGAPSPAMFQPCILDLPLVKLVDLLKIPYSVYEIRSQLHKTENAKVNRYICQVRIVGFQTTCTAYHVI